MQLTFIGSSIQASFSAIRTQADGYPGIPIIERQELNEYRKKKLC